jgi:hypothetical protein
MAARLGALASLLGALCCGAGWYSANVLAQSSLPVPSTAQGQMNTCVPAGLEQPADRYSIDGMECWLPRRLPELALDRLFAPQGQSLPDMGAKPGAVPADLIPPAEARPEPGFQVPLAGPVFLFGQVNHAGDFAAHGPSLNGQTGVAWRLSIPGAAELLIRGGPELSSLGSPQPSRVAEHSPFPFQPHWLRLEALGRWPLAKGVGLEYQGTACPALDPGKRDQIRQDLRFVFPTGPGGQLHFGAKYSWEGSGETKLGTESSQLYGGLQLQW